MGVSVSLGLLAVEVWPAALFAALVLLVAGLILTLSWLLGGRRYHGAEAVQYESGIKPAGPLPRRLSVEFYQVALDFVIFDLEVVFIFAWAVAARSLGWPGYFAVLVFVLLLLAGLVYLWRVGGLDWGAAGKRRRAAREVIRALREAAREERPLDRELTPEPAGGAPRRPMRNTP
jgi:NADH-quinone oxidoreductase subunit A